MNQIRLVVSKSPDLQTLYMILHENTSLGVTTTLAADGIFETFDNDMNAYIDEVQASFKASEEEWRRVSGPVTSLQVSARAKYYAHLHAKWERARDVYDGCGEKPEGNNIKLMIDSEEDIMKHFT